MNEFFEYSNLIFFANILLSALLGSMVFFSVIVAPNVFITLDSKNSRKFIRSIFPKLYLWGLAISFLCCLILYKYSLKLFVLCSVIFLGFLISKQILVPSINQASDNNKKNKFRLLHNLSVIIFITQILLIFFFLFLIK